MVHQKKYLKWKEMIELGYTDTQLRQFVKTEGCPAMRMNPMKKGSAWQFDIEKLEKWRKRLAYLHK